MSSNSPQSPLLSDWDAAEFSAVDGVELDTLMRDFSSDLPSSGDVVAVTATTTAFGALEKAPQGRQRRRRQQHVINELEGVLNRQKEAYINLSKENEALRAKHQLLEKLVHLRTKHVQVLTGTEFLSQVPLPNWVGPCPTGIDVPLFTLCSMPEAEQIAAEVDRAAVERMGRLQLARKWKRFLSDASLCLLALEQNPDDAEAERQLRLLCLSSGLLQRSVAFFNYKLLLQLLTTRLDTEASEIASADHWERVLSVVKLTPDQERDLLEVHAVFVKTMHELAGERKVLQQRLASGSAVAAEAVAAAAAVMTGATLSRYHQLVSYQIEPFATSSTAGDVRMCAEAEVIGELSRSLAKEASATNLVCGFLYAYTLTMRQYVQLCAHSYPFVPDSIALLSCLSRQQQHQQQQQQHAHQPFVAAGMAGAFGSIGGGTSSGSLPAGGLYGFGAGSDGSGASGSGSGGCVPQQGPLSAATAGMMSSAALAMPMPGATASAATQQVITA